MVRLTQSQYLEWFVGLKDRSLRQQAKKWAFAAMYGADPDAIIIMPATTYAQGCRPQLENPHGT